MITSRSVLRRMRTVSDEACRKNQNTHITFRNIPHPPRPNRAGGNS